MSIDLAGNVIPSPFATRKQSAILDNIESNLHQLEIGAARYSEDLKKLAAEARKEFGELRKMMA